MGPQGSHEGYHHLGTIAAFVTHSRRYANHLASCGSGSSSRPRRMSSRGAAQGVEAGWPC